MGIQPEQLLCPVLVGREDELATLRAGLDRAMQGMVRACFIAGEAGLGKSRLCRAIIQDARLRGLTPIVGLCSPQDTALPYGPIVDALRRTLARLTPQQTAMHSALAPLLPALAPLLPELGVAAPPAPDEPPATARRLLFEALSRMLRLVASYRSGDDGSPSPLVLMLEDVHWADESTLDLLGFLLRAARGMESDAPDPRAGLLVVATYRNEGLSTTPALTRTLSTLLASRVASEMELRPLTEEQITRLLAATLGRPVGSDLAAAIYERSEGNPFVAEELLGALAAAGHLDRDGALGSDVATLHLPLSLRGAVLERLDLLPSDTRTLLAAAAVAGRAFDADLLATVTALDRSRLLDGLRLALRGGLIEENPATGGSATSTTGDRYRFRHALTRDVIYGELLGLERRGLHAAVARALEERVRGDDAPGDAVETLAYHYRLAGDHIKAPLFALRAAERDRALLAFAEARSHYAEALSYLSEHDPARLPLLEAMGLLSLALLDVRGALPYIEAAGALLRGLGLARKAAVVLGEMHHLLWYVDLARFHAMVEELDAVAEAACGGDDGAGPEDGDALAIYGAAALAHAVYAHYRRANVWARRALDLAARLDPQAPLAAPTTYKALLARGHARLHGHLGDRDDDDGHLSDQDRDNLPGSQHLVEDGIQDLYATLELGLRYALPEVVQITYNFLPRGLLEVGRDAEAAALIDAADEYARRSGVAAIADMRGYSLLYAGRWDEGIAAMRAAIDDSRAIGAPAKLALELTALGHLLVARGDGMGADEALREALAILEPSEQFVTLGPCLGALARARALLGDDRGAATFFARGHALWRSTQDHSTAVPLLLDGCLFHAAWGDAPRAAEWADDLARVAGAEPTPVAAAAVAHARGAALAASGGHAGAQALLREAMERWSALTRPYDAARARAALGAAVLAAAPRDQARRGEAESLLVAAAESFGRLGATHDLTVVEDTRRRGGLLAQARRRQALAGGRAPFGDLTPRERDVLALLAAGRTNREIAQALFIAEGTAELHVSRILGKLGCATRAQAAAYAVAHQLVETP